MNVTTERGVLVDESGLRYKSKPGGSPFGTATANGSMSCFLCGVHKPRNQGQFRNVAGKSVLFCFECKPPKPKAETA